mmetsp:Transcript_14732/g.29989  ORF Transcript_14732/g.29989 Transcript_14732/m.29989 type:complete len:109 (+) Transcript_14732:571-897(+)
MVQITTSNVHPYERMKPGSLDVNLETRIQVVLAIRGSHANHGRRLFRFVSFVFNRHLRRLLSCNYERFFSIDSSDETLKRASRPPSRSAVERMSTSEQKHGGSGEPEK